MPTEPGRVGGGAESTQPWAPDWATESADSSVSSAPAWAPEAPQAPEASSLPSNEAAGSYAASSALDAPSTSAPTAASAGRTAGADGFVSLAADALSAAPAPSEPEPSALSYAEEVAADASAAASSEPAPAAGGLAVQLPREGRHVASSEEGEDQSAPAVEDSADLLNGPVAFDESSSYSGAASSQAGDAGDAAPETAGADAPGFSFPPLGADASGPGTAADGFIDASSVPASQPQGEPGPSPFAGPGEVPGAVSQEAAAPAYSESSYSEPSYSQPSVSEDFSQPAERSLAAPAPAAPEAPAAPAAAVDPLAERPTRPVGVVFGLGANVGGVVDSLRTAVQSLKATEGIEVTQVAPLARTLAVVAEGAEPQPDYLNTVVTAMTTLSPRELLEVCQSLEVAAGRVRTEPWGVRTLDVDLIDVEGVTSSDPALTLPHPRAAERAFVLVPWSQADPFAELAGHSVSELAENAPDRGGLRWLAFDWLDSEALPDKPTGPYVEPPVAQDAAGSEPGLVYDATRDESSVADASLSADYAGSISEASSPAPQPAAPAQPLSDQAPAESSPFGQSPFDTSNEASPWAEQAPQIDSPYQAASAPEAAGPQGAYAPGRTAGPDGGSHGQQDDAAGNAWKSPLQWNDVIGGGAQGTGPRQDA
nr:2-amino-4-hydroxy-6-hydroxymethyldihydropteridine diphosphokinase [Actinomyces oris]